VGQRLIKDAALRVQGFAGGPNAADSVATLRSERETARPPRVSCSTTGGNALSHSSLLTAPALAPRPLHAASGPLGEGNLEVTRPLPDARIQAFG